MEYTTPGIKRFQILTHETAPSRLSALLPVCFKRLGGDTKCDACSCARHCCCGDAAIKVSLSPPDQTARQSPPVARSCQDQLPKLAVFPPCPKVPHWRIFQLPSRFTIR
eukprot:1184844-Prorocentrum_minimum.AAC.3